MALFLTFNEERLASFRDHYRDNDLFRHWSPILCQLERECGGRDAISLWACSEQCLNRLRQVSQYRETEIDYILRELLQETDVTTAVTVMCMVLIHLMNAVEKGHEDESFDNEPMCVAIISIMESPPYKSAYKAIIDVFFGRKTGFDGKPVVIRPSDPMSKTFMFEDLANEDKEHHNKMKQFDTDTDDMQMYEDYKPTYTNSQNNNNCIVINGPVTNSTLMMPAASSSSKHKPKAAKPRTKAEKKSIGKPMTLKYYKHGNKGLLREQSKRVGIVFRKFTEWGWIDSKTSSDDFDAFFEGEPRHCNITWKASSTILTILLQELLKQSYIEKQTGCSAKSLVERQFGKTANSDKSRLDSDADVKIKAILYILDIRNTLDMRGGEGNKVGANTIDYSLISVYAELFDGQLRATKGI